MEMALICTCGMEDVCGFCSISEQIERWEMEEALREEYENNLEKF